MASANKFSGLINCTIGFSTKDGEYEGVVRRVVPIIETVVVGKIIILPNRTRLGTLNFVFSELCNIRVISRPVCVKEKSVKKKDVLPVYPKTEVEKLFDFDAGSDIEDGECADNRPAAYEMKLFPGLSKFVPNDFEIIDSFNRDFDLAIKHIRRQDAIGVSLEGIKISRSGTLTWLCISTTFCNFMFDILALGRKAFQKGLKSILENGRIQKIFHDSRLASDCLANKYGVHLANVFDTQVADYLVMMQMNQMDKIGNQVNTLDACLSYYLEVPYDYLYGQVNFDEMEDSLNFHALRPLRHDIQDVLIKNVMYLHLLKRELDLALMIPLRRATDVYLNCIQKLTEKELLVVPHQPYELPLDMHLDGIQIFRYKDFEYACSTVASGPPYREINNPFKNYLHYHAEYKKGQREDKQSIVNKALSENGKVTPLKLKCETTVKCREVSKYTCGMKPVAVNSIDGGSERDQDCSDDLERIHKCDRNSALRSASDSSTSTSQNTIVKSEASKFSASCTVRYPMKSGLMELLSTTSKENLKREKPTSDNSSGDISQISSENFSVDNKTTMSQDNNELTGLKSDGNLPVSSDNMSKPGTPCQVLGRLSQRERLEIIASSVASKSSTSCVTDESSAKDIIETSESICTKTSEASKEMENLKPTSNAELVHINNSVVRKDEEISDAEFEEIAARVRARGALLRNRKTEHSASVNPPTPGPSKSAHIEPKQTAQISSGKVEPTSEDVTIYYSDTIDNPSKFVVKVNHKSTRLVDLYKQAGDHSIFWNDDNSNSVPKSSPNIPNKPTDSEDFWSRIRGNRTAQPMSEKLRARLVPAGMAGY